MELAKVAKESHKARLSKSETEHVIGKNPLLYRLLRDTHAGRLALEDSDDDGGGDSEPAIKVAKGAADGDYTNAILFLSRRSMNHADEPSKSKGEKSSKTESVVMDDYDYDEKDTLDEPERNMLNNVEKKRRFALSLATLSSKGSKRVEIVTEGAIPALIDLASLPDNLIERCCATAFAYLALETEIREQMLNEGVFQALMNLSHNASRLVKADCIRAMCNLCCESDHEPKILKDGGASHILSVVVKCPEVLDICLKVLLNLSCIADKQPKLEEVSETLVHIWTLQGTHGISMTQDDEEVAISTICNLSAIRGNQLKVLEDGCLKIVEKLLQSKSAKLRRIAAEALKNLTTDYRTRSKLIENNVIKLLLQISTDPDEDVKTTCVKSFYNIARDTLLREKLVNANAVQVIIKMSMQKILNVEMGRTAAKILKVLCSDRLIAYKLVADGIIKALMALLRTEDSVIYQYCAESVCCLFQISSVVGRLVEQGAVGVLVSLSQTNTNPVTGEWCSFALFHLVTNNACPSGILEHGVLPCLMGLCQYPTVRTIYFCSASLAYMTQLKSVDASGSIPLLIDMLRSDPDLTTKTNCAVALYNMIDKDDNCYTMLDAGALPYIVSLVHNNQNIQTTMKYAAILSRLSLHKQYYNQFGSDGVLKVLLDLSSVDHIPTQRRVVIAISNLSNSEELRSTLLDLKPIPYIISLASRQDENLRRGCVSIICNLASDVGTEKGIADDGIIPTLLTTAIITSDQISCKIVCVKALTNLMADKSLHKMMVDAGVIWGLSSLAMIDDSELLSLCAEALCLFSGPFAREMISSVATVRTIMKLINSTELDLLRAGARALTNMLMKTTDADETFRKQSVLNMRVMAQASDEDVCEMCILCLCLSSQSNSCLESIVSSGMLSYIDSNTIFTDTRVSYAYLTMFSNIANDTSMRSKILDDKAIDRFKHIILIGLQELDLAVSKCIYSVSCSVENIVKLVQWNVLSLIHSLIYVDYEKSYDVMIHLVAILYNLTTCKGSQAKLVSSGIMELFTDLWPVVRRDFTLCSLTIYSVAHLCCGNINTARVVQDGCAPVLCFVVKCKEYEECLNFSFPVDLYIKVAASIRNLLCVVCNHNALISADILDTLIMMATEAQSGTTTDSGAIRRKKAIAHKSRAARLNNVVTRTSGSGDLVNMQQKHQQSAKAAAADAPAFNLLDNPEYASIFGNCASSLRSLTFNTDARQLLISSGALNIILSDLKNDMQGEEIQISHKLLSELEAESWVNGGGKKKDGRAAQLEPNPLYMTLLGSTVDVHLSVDIRSLEIEKFRVTVDLEEPEMEHEEITFPVLEIGIADLSSLEEGEDNINPIPMSYKKQECIVSSESIQLLYKKDSTIVEPVKESLDAHEKTLENGFSGLSVKSSQIDDKQSSLETLVKMKSSLPALKRIKKVDSVEKFKKLLTVINVAKKNRNTSAQVHEEVVNEWRNLSRF